MMRIAAVLFEGFEMLDLYGPLELFSMHRDAFEIVTVAQTAGPVSASGGPPTVAMQALKDAGPFDIILVPGGAGTRNAQNEEFLGWLATAGESATYVCSVCTGAHLLADAGLLDGKRATTNKRAYQWVVDQNDAPHWVARARWVEDGKFFTSSGVSAGMDMTLALIEKILDTEAAENAANWAEYIWNKDPDEDPFAEGMT